MNFDQICPRRLAAMQTAVELDVDKDDFALQSDEESMLWDELADEFDQIVARLGRLWTVDQ